MLLLLLFYMLFLCLDSTVAFDVAVVLDTVVYVISY